MYDRDSAGIAEKMTTPLQPKEFFRGNWKGNGRLIAHPLLRWLVPEERIHLSSEVRWLSETIWIVNDHFEFSSGRTIDRKMFAELIAPDRIHVTADDMPLGADILLFEDGFQFSPYIVLATYKGRIYRVRCKDKCRVDADGYVWDEIKICFCGLPVARVELGPIDRGAGK
ncbi:MAG TPA: hypothetical protein VHM88_25275 [Candidatus Acidoferrales bacterium]|nr:hypothetical protein [Candidatus Acidoferrales bacterium]